MFNQWILGNIFVAGRAIVILLSLVLSYRRSARKVGWYRTRSMITVVGFIASVLCSTALALFASQSLWHIILAAVVWYLTLRHMQWHFRRMANHGLLKPGSSIKLNVDLRPKDSDYSGFNHTIPAGRSIGVRGIAVPEEKLDTVLLYYAGPKSFRFDLGQLLDLMDQRP